MSAKLHIMGQRLAQEDLTTSSRHNELLSLLQHILEGRTYMTCNLDHKGLLPNRSTEAHTDETPSFTRVNGDIPCPTGSEIVPLNQSAVQALNRNSRKPRLSICPCRCHINMRCSTSAITSKFFGSLVIGIVGRIFGDQACDSPNCRNHPHFSITVAYYFPSWLIAKAIIFQCVRQPYGQPAFGLRVRNLLPEHSPAMRATEGGDPLALRSILEDRISTPNDMEEMAWTLLTI